MNLPLMITDRRQALYGHVYRLPRKLQLIALYYFALTLLMAAAQVQIRGALVVGLDGCGCTKWKKTSEPVSVLPTPLPKIGQFGDRYDPLSVMRVSE